MVLRPQPLIAVRDVEASSRFYQRLLDCESGHEGREYERLVSDGELVLQLHDASTAHHHGRIGDPALPYGNGVVLWFALEAFDAAVARVRELRAEIVGRELELLRAVYEELESTQPDGLAGYLVYVAACTTGRPVAMWRRRDAGTPSRQAPGGPRGRCGGRSARGCGRRAR